MANTGTLISTLSDQEVERYHNDGFLLLDRPLISPEALQEVREQLDRLFDHFARLVPRYARDLAPGARPGEAPRIPEVDFPSKLAPKLMSSPVLSVCTSVARQLHGRFARLTYDHAIYKPPLNEAATPWHQDAAYAQPGELSVGIWVPLQDVPAESGCMRFVPGSHRSGLADHSQLASESNPSLLGAEVDESAAVACPVRAGGLVVHNVMTLHSTGPNLGASTRRVWVLNFGSQPLPPATLRSRLYELRAAIIRAWLLRP